jgi:hypothetical protein
MIWSILLISCSEDPKPQTSDTSEVVDTDTDIDTSPDTDTDTGPLDTGEPIPEIEASFQGGIDIQLYTLTPSGDREFISWEDAYPDGSFPFGNIFVGAYWIDSSGATQWVGETVIENPQASDNQFEIDFNLEAPEEIRVFAILDYNGDKITGTVEPLGVYPRGIRVDPEETSFENLSIDILSPLYEPQENCEETLSLTIDGEAIVTGTYDVGYGDVAIFVMQPGNIGPVHSQIITPEPAGGGGVGDYSLSVCQELGFMLLKGVWDDNLNGMFDPIDEAGTYISAPNESGNPVNVSYSNLSDYEIQIPFESSSALNIVPFVQLSGTVIPENGTFDTYPEGSSLYMVAMKYRVEQEFSTDVFEEEAYDLVEYTWEDLQGKSFVPWTLTVPSETIAYLWAYIDVDNDGLLNEPGEPIAVVAGGEDGRYPTGNESQSDIQMILTSNIE